MKTVKVADLTHKRLKIFAEMEKVSLSEAVKRLIDFQGIPVVRPGPGYAGWLQEMVHIGETEGEEAAAKWREDHPYKPSEE